MIFSKRHILLIGIIVSLTLSGCGFFDFERVESKRIVGKIFIFNLHIPQDSGYYIVFRRTSEDIQYLLNDFEYVDYIKGNDSILLVKSSFENKIRYHLIRHVNGDSILNVSGISDRAFEDYQKAFPIKYLFNALAQQ